MNKEQAIKLLSKDTSIAEINKLKQQGLNKEEVTDKIQEAMDMGIEALEKQIAKNPYIWGDGYYNGELILDMYDCPNCEKSYEIECDKYEYCPNCGQKIDWSEADENKEDN